MSDSKTTQVELSFSGEIAEIKLIPPDGKPPTLDQAVLAELESAVEKIEDASPRIVYLESASERFFCVGANIAVLKETNTETIGPWVRDGHRVLNRLEDLPCPVVALVSGYAMGGGLELAMACDLIFANDSAKFAQSEASLGFIPGWGGSRRLVDRIGVARAKYYFYSGDMMDAATASQLGLVECVGELGEMRASFAEKVLEKNHNALRTYKKILNSEMLERRARNMDLEASLSVGCLEDADTLERLDTFLTRKGKR